MTSLDFSVMPRCIRLNQLVLDIQFCGRSFKKSGFILLAAGKPVCKFKTIIRLNAFDLYAFARKSANHLFQEICRRIGALLGIGAQYAIARVFINGGILVKTKFFICDAASGNDLDVNLDPLAGMRQLLLRLGLMLFLGCGWLD